MSSAKRILVGLTMTALTLVAIFFVVRRSPDNVRALFQA